MKINLLLCDTFPGLLPPFINSYAEMFANLFKVACPNVETKVYYTFLGELPEMNDEDIFLITGCNQSAYDHDDWILSLIKWTQTAVASRCKLVGICFGHQLIAQALGGKVKRAINGWGTGIRESYIVDAFTAELFGDQTLSLLYNHHDQVTELPPGAIKIATSDFCENEGFRIGRQVITFQGHPEYTVPYAEHLLRNHSAGEDKHTVDEALKSLTTKVHKGPGIARLVVELMA